MFTDSEHNAIVVVDETPKGSNTSARNNDTSLDDKTVELVSDFGMVAGCDDECRNLGSELKDPGEIVGSAVERIATPAYTANSQHDGRYDEENVVHATGAQDCGTPAGSNLECAVDETSNHFAERISSNSIKIPEQTASAKVAPIIDLGQLLSYTREGSESKEAMSEVEAGSILSPVQGPSSALPISSREGADTHNETAIGVSASTNGHSENRIIDPFDSPLSALTELPSESESEQTKRTPFELHSNSNIECNGVIPSSSCIACAKTTSQFPSDTSFRRSSTSDATSSEILTPRSSTPPPRLIMDCVIPPPFYFPKKLYRPMSEVHPEMVAPPEVKSSDENKKVCTSEEGKMRQRHRSRSPLHKHDEPRALELFGSGLTMYSCFGYQGGFQIARGALQCLPEDDGRASFAFPMTDELRRRLEEGMAEAREELAENNLGAMTSAKPRMSKQGTKKKGKSKQKGKDANDRLSSEWSTCHGCARKTGIPKMVCCAVFSNGTLCTKRFCAMCINRKYPDIQFDEERTDFTCPKCLGTCLCAPCSRKRDSLRSNQELGPGVNAGPSTEIAMRRTTNGPEDWRAKADDRHMKQDASVTRPSVHDSSIPLTEGVRRKRPFVRDSQRTSQKGNPPGIRQKAGEPRSGSPIAKCNVVDDANNGEADEGSEQGAQGRPSALGLADRKQLSEQRALSERSDAKLDDDCRKNCVPENVHSRFGRAIKPTEKTRRSSRDENDEPEATTRQRKRRRTDSISARSPSSSDHPVSMQVLLGSPTYEASRPTCDNDSTTLRQPIADAIISS